MGRWSEQETLILAEVRSRLSAKLADRPQFPEVVGDRRLIRFIRGYNYDIDMICMTLSDFLDWRKAQHIDDIRDDIVKGGLNSPLLFPYGNIILSHLNIMFLYTDESTLETPFHELKHPLFCEDMIPADMWKEVSIEEYILFRTYCLEFIALRLEYLSDAREERYMEAVGKEYAEGWGYIEKLIMIKDVSSLTVRHFASETQAVGHTVMELSTTFYPDVLEKAHVINVSWLFSMMFNIKSRAKADMRKKINVHGCGQFSRGLVKGLFSDVAANGVMVWLGGNRDKLNQCNGPFDFSPVDLISIH